MTRPTVKSIAYKQNQLLAITNINDAKVPVNCGKSIEENEDHRLSIQTRYNLHIFPQSIYAEGVPFEAV